MAALRPNERRAERPALPLVLVSTEGRLTRGGAGQMRCAIGGEKYQGPGKLSGPFVYGLGGHLRGLHANTYRLFLARARSPPSRRRQAPLRQVERSSTAKESQRFAAPFAMTTREHRGLPALDPAARMAEVVAVVVGGG